MSQPVNTTEVPLTTLSPAYIQNTMSTVSNDTPSTQPEQNQEALRLKGGAGCLTECLAAIGCCCICEECCC
ncbi:hypothetical protein BY458DRAFT_558432 [Sporodiniella umbellata]|nr:hypothetical protein BY458DRAFT_558432 [Sporodiniella umbellata]